MNDRVSIQHGSEHVEGGRVERWLHLSDLHFGAEQSEVCVAFSNLVAAQNPRGLVVSGDVTQRAKHAEYRAASTFLTQLRGDRQLVIVPGNHDIPLLRLWERVASPYGQFERAFGGVSSVRVIDTPTFRFVLVNTTRWFRHRRGSLSPEQIDHVEREILGSPAGKVCAVVLHHPLPASDEGGRSLRDAYFDAYLAEEAVRRWAEAGLHLALCGHAHHPRLIRLAECEGSAPWLVQAGTSLSHRLRGGEPNSVYLVAAYLSDEHTTLQLRPRLTVERWDYSPISGRFEQISQCLLN